jgi:hypothetical protein
MTVLLQTPATDIPPVASIGIPVAVEMAVTNPLEATSPGRTSATGAGHL